MQPAERLWPLTNEPLVNRHFASIDELTAVQEARCRALATMTEAVRGRTLFHWWPQVHK